MKKQISQSLVLFVLMCVVTSCAPSGQDSQVALDESFGNLKASESAMDWELSPSNFSTKLAELRASNTSSKEFCTALMKRSDEELALIADELNDSENQDLVADCSVEYKTRVAAYFKSMKANPKQRSGKGIKTEVRVFDPHAIRFIKGTESILKDKEVILTFDDGPTVETSSQIVNTLRRFNYAKAMFFMVGARVKTPANGKFAAQIYKEGHTIASHSMNHLGTKTLFKAEGKAAVDREIFKAHELIGEKAGHISPYMRFPGGTSNEAIDAYVYGEGLSIWHWNMDSLDFKTPNPAEIVSRVKKLLEKNRRGVILFHDIKHQTVLALPEIMHYLEDNGYKLILPVEK